MTGFVCSILCVI